MAVKNYEEIVREEAPEALLRLDESSGTTAADATRFGRDFTHSGSPALDQTGPVNKAVSYDGTDDETTYSANMPITGYPFTIEAWMQTPGSPANSTRFCYVDIGDASADTDGAYISLFTDSSGNLYARVEVEQGGTEDIQDYRISNNLIGEWVHVVAQYVSATERSLYANSQLVGTATTSVSFPSNLDNIALGNLARNTDDFSEGLIAEPAFYNYQLSAERIRAHHAIGRGNTETDSFAYAMMAEGPLIWWRLQESSGTTAADASGNKLDGTYAGSPTLDQTGPLSGGVTTKAVSYDGTDDHTSVTDATIPPSAYPFTMMAWMRTPATPTNSDWHCYWALEDGHGGGGNHFLPRFRIDASGNISIEVALRNGSSQNVASQSIPNTLIDSWVHVVVVYNGSADRDIYVNATLVLTSTVSNAPSLGACDTFALGELRWADAYKSGLFAEPALFHRDIGADAIRNIYAKGKQWLEKEYRTHVLPKCPSLYWRQGESSGSTASDETDFQRDGAYAGTGPTLGRPGALTGDDDTAVSYNGSDDQLSYSEDFITQYPITIEAWLKLPGTVTAGTSYIRVGLTDASGSHKMVVGLKTDANSKLRAFLEEVGSSTGTINNDCGGAVGNWHHVVGVFNSDTSRKLYVNAVELEEDTTSVSITLSNLDTVCVGYEDLSSDAFYSGESDELAIYQRALSAAEIRDNYVSGLGYHRPATLGSDDAGYLQLMLESGPSLLWPQNETSGTTVAAADRFGLDGAYAGGFTLDESGPLSNYKAVNYDGADGEAAYTDADDIPISGYPFVIESWLKSPSTLANSTDYAFFGIADSGGTNDEFGVLLRTDGSGNIFVRGNIRVGGTDDHLDQNSGTGIAAQNNQWIHVALVCRSATERELYVMGRSVAGGSGLTSHTFPSTLDTVAAGKLATSSPSFYAGDQAMGVFFDHDIGVAAIRDHFMAGRGIFEAANPYVHEVGQLVPAVHYRFNEDSGSPADLMGLRGLTKAGAPTQANTGGPIYNIGDDGLITFDGSDDAAARADDAQVTAYPFAVIVWVKTPSAPGASAVFGQSGMGDDGTDNNGAQVALQTDGAGNVTPSGLFKSSGTTDNLQPAAPVLEADVFHHVALICRSATDRELVVNGASAGTDTTSLTFPANMDDIVAGRDFAGSPTFRAGSVAEWSVITSNLTVSEVRSLYLSAFEALERVGETYQRSITDGFSLDESTSLLFVNTIEETLGLSESLIIKWSKSLVDAFGLHDALSTVMLFKQALTEGLSLDDAPSGVMVANNTIVDGLGFDDTASATAQLKNLITEGISFQIGLSLEDEAYTGLVVNTKNFALSRYTNYNFNSFAKVSEAYFGAAEDGIYHLEGDDDAGTQINAAIKTAAMNFGTDFQKRVPRAYLGLRGDGELYLKTITNEDEEFWYRISNVRSTFHNHRAKLGRGVKATYWQFELSNEEDGSFFELDSMTLIPVLLTKRVKC